MTSLEIPAEILKQIIEQAIKVMPIEVCGILAGKNSRVEKLYKMTNTDKSSAHFMMSPREQFKVAKDIRRRELKILAIYHSHPATPARPSVEDIRLAFMPDVIYVIVSLQDENKPIIRGFLIEDSSATEVPLEIIHV